MGNGKQTYEIASHCPCVHAEGSDAALEAANKVCAVCQQYTGSKIKALLCDIVQRMEGIGITPLLLVCNQGGPVWSLLKTKLKVTIQKPFFYIGSTKIFAMPA